MAEDPIKLFNTRAERYPEATDADLAQGAARAALAAIPVIGGTVTEVLSVVTMVRISRFGAIWAIEYVCKVEANRTG